MSLVFIIGPLFTGDRKVTTNIEIAVKLADELVKNGICVYVPHLHFFWDLITPKTETHWLAYGQDIIQHCDAALRIPGRSNGAQSDEDFCLKIGKPVFYNMAEVLKWHQSRNS